MQNKKVKTCLRQYLRVCLVGLTIATIILPRNFAQAATNRTNLYSGTSGLNADLNIGSPGVFTGFLQEYSWIVLQISPR
jgi:hypothetical protein